jgi:hypothetical protein
VWYVTDIIMNLSALPRNPLVNALFRVSGSAPGLGFDNLAPLSWSRRRLGTRVLARLSHGFGILFVEGRRPGTTPAPP